MHMRLGHLQNPLPHLPMNPMNLRTSIQDLLHTTIALYLAHSGIGRAPTVRHPHPTPISHHLLRITNLCRLLSIMLIESKR